MTEKRDSPICPINLLQSRQGRIPGTSTVMKMLLVLLFRQRSLCFPHHGRPEELFVESTYVHVHEYNMLHITMYRQHYLSHVIPQLHSSPTIASRRGSDIKISSMPTMPTIQSSWIRGKYAPVDNRPSLGKTLRQRDMRKRRCLPTFEPGEKVTMSSGPPFRSLRGLMVGAGVGAASCMDCFSHIYIYIRKR